LNKILILHHTFGILTEVLVDLREAVLQIGRHFQLADARLAHLPLTPDYSMESHGQDHEIYAGVMRSKKRRAKALLDFERHDDDELGFRKNDVITVISQKVCRIASIFKKMVYVLFVFSYYFKRMKTAGSES
jgi:hypothetical protein